MFENTINELHRLNEFTVSVPIKSDEKGYLDKQCPSEECQFLFKVNEEDWGTIFKEESVWCPFCRHEAPADQWFTIEQIEHAKTEAIDMLQGKINNVLISDARKFNQRQPKSSFVTISMEVKGGARRTHIIPAEAAELMELEIQCEKCQSHFAVIGSAYFCPACGNNSVAQTFLDSLRKITAKKDSLNIVRKALIESVGKDEAELTCRSLLETCILDGVMAFQKYCGGLYTRFGQAPVNAFQRLDQGSNIWAEVLGKGYSDWLSKDELSKLYIIFQKRHILSHNDGIVDDKYIVRSGDSSYKEGQRITVSEDDIDLLLFIIEKLSSKISTACDKYQTDS